ncbi:MAG: hypothetical protein ABRQ27_14990, partial [Clostridiaceae bacterium]
IIKGIDIDDSDSAQKLKDIIKRLTIGKVYYFHFQRENNFFLTDAEIQKFRNEIPQYLSSNGKYLIKYKIDDERFDSIGQLWVNEDTYAEILLLWRYFEGVTFFSPNEIFVWGNYEKIYDKIIPEEYGIGIIQNKYADSVFIKGHDGDNLIFVYGPDYDEDLVTQIIDSTGNF